MASSGIGNGEVHGNGGFEDDGLDGTSKPDDLQLTGGGDSRVEPDSGRILPDQRSGDCLKLLEYGLDEKVAAKLDDVYKTGNSTYPWNNLWNNFTIPV